MTKEKHYYVYAHYINHSLFPFYIGYSSLHTKSGNKKFKYKRANDLRRRSKEWENVYTKHKDTFRVEVLFESNDRIEALNKEYEYINKFGIYTDGGLLTNLSPGHKDGRNYYSEAMREKLRVANTGRKATPETIEKMKKAQKIAGNIKRHSKPIYRYDLDGRFVESHIDMADAARDLGLNRSSLSKFSRADGYACGFYWFREFQGDKISIHLPERIVYNKKIVAIDLDTGMSDIFHNTAQASITLFGNKKGCSYILGCLLGKRTHYQLYKFCYA